MPTKHPRTFVTHTPAVVHALEVARQRWPGDRESALIQHLLDEGAKAVEASLESDQRRRGAQLQAVAGRYTEMYGPGYLDELREGWNA